MEYIEINIKKPLFANYVCIRDKILYQAINSGKKIKVNGVIKDPAEWIDSGRKIEKVFKIPDRPMKLVCNYV